MQQFKDASIKLFKIPKHTLYDYYFLLLLLFYIMRKLTAKKMSVFQIIRERKSGTRHIPRMSRYLVRREVLVNIAKSHLYIHYSFNTRHMNKQTRVTTTFGNPQRYGRHIINSSFNILNKTRCEDLYMCIV